MPVTSRRRAVAAALLAAVLGCGDPEADAPATGAGAPPPTSPPATAAAPTTTPRPTVPPAAAVPEVPPIRHGQGRARPLRVPRMPRPQIRAALAEAIAARRPDRPLPSGELERLTNQAMHIRVTRSRLARLRPELADTPRVQHLQARLDQMIADFEARSGLDTEALGELLDPKPTTATVPR